MGRTRTELTEMGERKREEAMEVGGARKPRTDERWRDSDRKGTERGGGRRATNRKKWEIRQIEKKTKFKKS